MAYLCGNFTTFDLATGGNWVKRCLTSRSDDKVCSSRVTICLSVVTLLDVLQLWTHKYPFELLDVFIN